MAIDLSGAERGACPECGAATVETVTPVGLHMWVDAEPSEQGYYRLDHADGKLLLQPVFAMEREQALATYGPLYGEHRCPVPVSD